MTKNIDNEKVKMGNIIKVNNLNRKSNNATYIHYALKLENADGENERWVLFTERQLMAISKTISHEMSELMKPGRLYKGVKNSGKKKVAFCRIGNKNNGAEIWTLTEKQIANAENRAKNNPEDIPHQSKLADLFD